jgi:hypothetical protein
VVRISPSRRLAKRVGFVLLPDTNPAGAIYGVIVIGSLLAAESSLHETYFDTFVSMLLVTCIYWLAHSYAEVLGRRLRLGERLAAGALARALIHEWSLIRGALIPLGALVVCWIAGFPQTTAVNVALWCSAASLALFELVAGLRSGADRGQLALDVAVGVAMGVAILALKVILH